MTDLDSNPNYDHDRSHTIATEGSSADTSIHDAIRDTHDAIGNQAASIITNHGKHIEAHIETLIDTLMELKERLAREAREARATIDLHTRLARTVDELCQTITKVLKGTYE